MAMPKLTKRIVESLVSKAQDYIAFDDEVKGFGVRVLPSGTKSYLVQYRSAGRTRRVKIGRHGLLTADEARKKAKELLGAVAKGDNPAHTISEHRGAPTLATVCERFYREHVLERCKPSTQGEYRRAIDLFIKPALGAFKIVDIVRADIARLHHNHRDKPYQANRTLGVLSKLFNLAEIWGLRTDGTNPCRHVPKYAERKRERFLLPHELERLGQVLSELEGEGSESPHVVAAFRLLILTGCRVSEIQTLKWTYIQNNCMALPDSKTGARKIPLPPAAMAVLDNLERIPANEYVITGTVRGQAISDLQKPWRRHTYASNAVMQGLSLPMVGKLLGHTQIQTTMRYAHLADDHVREAARKVSAELSLQFESGMPDKPILRVIK
jgi:integrase